MTTVYPNHYRFSSSSRPGVFVLSDAARVTECASDDQRLETHDDTVFVAKLLQSEKLTGFRSELLTGKFSYSVNSRNTGNA